MKTITKKYLEKEINGIRESNLIINCAASSSPFGNSMNLEQTAKEFMDGLEERVRIEIWQKHRIKVLESLLEEIN